MTLKEVGIVIEKKLVTRRGLGGKILIDFEDVEIKEGNILRGVCGYGKTVTKAKASYCRRIRGQILAVDAMLETRKAIQLPPKITVR